MSFTRSQIAKIAGLSLRQVQFYTEEGFVELEGKFRTGRGHRREYSKQNLMELLIIKEFSDYGITKPKMMRMLSLVRTHPYVKMYSNTDNCRKNIKLFLCFYINSNNAIKVDYIIPGVKDEILLPKKEYEEYKASYLLINFTKILNKMD